MHAPEFMAIHRPHAVVKHNPEWMCKMMHHWMITFYPMVLFENNPTLVIFLYPDTAFRLNPYLLCEQNISWVVKYIPEYLIDNYPHLLQKFDPDAHFQSVRDLDTPLRKASFWQKLGTFINSRRRKVVKEITVPASLLERAGVRIHNDQKVDIDG